MAEKKIVILGAGKIGRGFIGDLFDAAGYRLTFADAAEALVKQLQQAGEYTLLALYPNGETATRKVKNYDTVFAGDLNALSNAVCDTDLMSVSVFPKDFDSVAATLAQCIAKRAEKGIENPLNILLCTNIFDPKALFTKALTSVLKPEYIPYFNEHVGIIESIVIRMAVPPTEEQLANDSLIAVTNGYPELYIDSQEWKGSLLEVKGISYVENMKAFELRKYYTYNMLHAFYSYVGQRKGLRYVYECTKDPEVQHLAEKALDEVLDALHSRFGFTMDDLTQWKKSVFYNMANPALKDELWRVGANPIRKLAYHDRLTGPAVMCLEEGQFPYYLAKGIAAGILYENPQDPDSQQVARFLTINGLWKTIREYCGVEMMPELEQLIYENCSAILEERLFSEDDRLGALMKRAFSTGFKMEKLYRGCGQCIWLALNEVTGKVDDETFKALSGFSGGMGLCGDGACGGYCGGMLFMGQYVGRRKKQMEENGDKVSQYKSYSMSQDFHDLILQTYGSVVCKDIHQRIFGQDYCLRTKPVRVQFEDAGAHTVKCTSVIGMLTTFAMRVLIQYKYYSLDNE